MAFKAYFLAGVALLLAGSAVSSTTARAQDRITVTDVAGRTVTIKRPVKRIVLGEGRQLLTLALLRPDPVSILAGWPGDLKRQDKTTYNLYRARFPGLDHVPIIGRGSADTFSIEQALAAQPDIAILSGGYGPSVRSTEVIRRFEDAGVPVLFVDFVDKPLLNTVPSIALLGKVLGVEQKAEAFVDFYNTRMNRITKRLKESNEPRPTVLMHAHAGLHDCCNSPSHATIGAFVDAAGGDNIAVEVIKQAFGKLNLEYVIDRNPEVYIGTGGIHMQGTGGLVMGPGIDVEVSRKLLSELAQRPGIAQLDAVRNNRVHGLWHLFNNMPLNILAVEALAKWFHPALFADVDPDASLRELNEKFLTVPMQGTYWVSLKPAAGR